MRSSDRNSSDSTTPTSPLLPKSAVCRTPRSAGKTPRLLRHRVFASLERKADKVINLLTPKRIRTDGGPMVLKRTKVKK
jgi:hypothetical protein